MWRANAWRRFTLPVPVFLNRLDAPLWVFSFGIEMSQGETAGRYLFEGYHSPVFSARLDYGRTEMFAASDASPFTVMITGYSPAERFDGT